MNQTRYIQAVIMLMSLLMISRVKTFITSGMLDIQTLIFTLIEGLFLLWGIWVLKKDQH